MMVGILFWALIVQQPHDATFCVQRLTDHLGGQARWDRLRYLRFDFAVERHGREVSRHRHLWDKWTGRYRVEGKNRQGQHYRILFTNVVQKKGRVMIDGTEIAADSASKFLDYGHARFINDTYWLAMPWKLNDPGVQVAHTTDADRCILTLTFQKVGLTPGDTYYVIADASTGQLRGWKYKLEDGEEGDFDWTGWVEKGGLQWSEVKRSRDSTSIIRTDRIATFDALSDSCFTAFDYPFPQ